MNRSCPSHARRAALIGLAFGLPATVAAEPLSHVQTVVEGEGDAIRFGNPTAFAVGGNRLFAVSSTGGLVHFERDPATGRLTWVESIAPFEDAAPVAEGDIDPRAALALLSDDRLLVATRSRSPENCTGDSGASGGCVEFGTTLYSVVDGVLRDEGSNDAGRIRPPLRVSPDGRHAYGEGRTGDLDVYAIDGEGQLRPVESLRAYRLDGNFADLWDMVLSPDGRRLFVLSNRSSATNVVTALARDASTGRLSAVAELDLTAEGLVAFGDDTGLSVAPDGTALYVGVRSDEDARTGLARIEVATDGALALRGVDASAEAAVPRSLNSPGRSAVGAAGRLVAIGNRFGGADGRGRALHLFTVGDDGATAHRGFEASGSGGVPDDALDDLAQVGFSDDGAFVYAFAPDHLSVFAAHADLEVGIETGSNALAGGEIGATVRLANAGPAFSHGVVATVRASGEILSVGDGCSVDGDVATCRVDEIRARGAAEIPLRLRAPRSGEATLSVVAAQYQTDLDESSNALSVAVPVVADASDVQTGPEDAGGDVADDPVDAPEIGSGSGSGGGCSVATGESDDPIPWLLALGAFGSLVSRRRRARAAMSANLDLPFGELPVKPYRLVPRSLPFVLVPLLLGSCGGGGSSDPDVPGSSSTAEANNDDVVQQGGATPEPEPDPPTAGPAGSDEVDLADVPSNGSMYLNENGSARLSGPVFGTGELSNDVLARRLPFVGSPDNPTLAAVGGFLVKAEADPADPGHGIVAVVRNPRDAALCGIVTGVTVLDPDGERLETTPSSLEFGADGSSYVEPARDGDGNVAFDECVPSGGQAFAWNPATGGLPGGGLASAEVGTLVADGAGYRGFPADEGLVDTLVAPLSYEVSESGDIRVLVENRDGTETFEVAVVLYPLDEDGFPLGRGRGRERVTLGPGESGTVVVVNDFFAGTATTVRAVVRTSIP